jgi:flagellar hook-basal body complex protein FliE
VSADISSAVVAVQASVPADKGAQAVTGPGVIGAFGAHPSRGFGDLVTQGLAQVNQQLLTSQADLQNLAVGNVQNLHQIMIRMEESKLSFQLMMQVRSRLLEAYQDVMKMQV